jgi:hypothetical protein
MRLLVAPAGRLGQAEGTSDATAWLGPDQAIFVVGPA